MFDNPFSFEGRIRRTEYGISRIVYTAVIFVLSTVISNTLFFLTVSIPLVWFMLAQGTKRCHDINKSGWYQLIPFYELWMLFVDSEAGENEYGANPKTIVDTYETEAPDLVSDKNHLT